MLLLRISSIIFVSALAHGSLEKRMKIDIVRHYPCLRNRYSRWVQKLTFPNSTVTDLKADFRNPGCYWIGGDVRVNERIRGQLQVHMEMHNQLSSDSVPEVCHKPDRSGCGGFGSCLYCDVCETLDKTNKETSSRVRITQNGRSLSCGANLSRGVHRNIQIYFCLPTKKEFLEIQGVSQNVWEEMQRRLHGSGKRMGVMMTVRVFNSRVDRLMVAQLRMENYYRRVNHLKHDAVLPADVYKLLPFNRLISSNDGFIGCHKVYGTVMFDDDDFRS